MSNSNKTCVIVDDNLIVTARHKTLAEQAGLTVVATAQNGIDALKAIKDKQPDLVLLDIIMPVMDGVECYTKAFQEGFKGKIFFVSALSSEERFVTSFQETIDEIYFLEKPLTLDVIKNRVLSENPIKETAPLPPSEEAEEVESTTNE